MRLRRRAGLAAALAATLAIAPAAADDFANLLSLGLPVIEGSVPVYYSPDAEAEAKVYAETFARAVAWLREELDWHGEIAMAVLDEEYYGRVSFFVPYPIPYADTGGRQRLVVMPDRIDSYPGFDKWDLEPISLNAALTLHEIGHILAKQTGIWSGNHWVNELIANVFLAGYARAEAPSFAVLLDGVPPRFVDAGRITSLGELDVLYAGVGLENYAWFQFRLADIADHIVTGRAIADVVAALQAEFPAGSAQIESTADTLERLERIAPGTAALAADMTGPSNLPNPGTVACPDEPDYSEGSALVFFENHADAPLVLTSYAAVEIGVDVAIMIGDLDESEKNLAAAEALSDFRFATTIEPGNRLVETPNPGEVYLIRGGDCIVVPAGPSRFVWKGD